MYYCQDCGFEFVSAAPSIENHDFLFPPFEQLYVCPNCHGTNYHEKNVTHCRCCGAKLYNNKTEYCSARCREKGKIMWEKQRAQRYQSLHDPLHSITNELTAYNSKHKTKYSYGQYVALIRPTLRKRDN